nr:OmpA family protein [uncultured Cohaesibacter sp.]
MSLLKSWLIPGALAVAAVAGLSLYGETKKIEADLTGRALAVLESRDMDWARVSFSGRDATLTGIAPEEGAAQEASELLLSEWGVRVVKDKTDLLTAQSPYTWGLTRKGEALTMIGYLPYYELKKAPAEIAASIKGAQLEMSSVEAARGAPADIHKAVLLAIELLASLPEGKVMLIDDKLTLSGSLENSADGLALYDTLRQIIEKAELGAIAIDSQIMEPKATEETSDSSDDDAVMDGLAIRKSADGLSFEGIVPSMIIKDDILEQARRKFGNGAISDGLIVRGGGEIAGLSAQDYKQVASAILQAVSRLDAGQAIVSKDGLKLDGSAYYQGALDQLQASLQDALPQGIAFTPALQVSAPGEAVDADACQALLRDALEQNTILFDSGKASISSDSFGLLDGLIFTARRCPDSHIQIEGHTDSDGEDLVNQTLSEERANAVAAYLASAGLGEERLQAKGFGESRPVASNDTPEGKARNRRIEFVILEQ